MSEKPDVKPTVKELVESLERIEASLQMIQDLLSNIYENGAGR